GIGVAPLTDIAQACAELPVVMPTLVAVLGTLDDDERESFADNAGAVGALVIHIDPELDEETLGELVERAIRIIGERGLKRETAAGNALSSVPPGDDVDDKW